jgi:hypothetical protein
LHSPDEGGVDHEGDEGCPGLWQVNSPAACQDMHGPDEGGVDHVQDEGGEWCPGFWRVNSPAACQYVHGPDEGGVDHIQDEGGEWDLASRHGTQSHPHHQRPGWRGGGATIDERRYRTDYCCVIIPAMNRLVSTVYQGTKPEFFNF